MMRHFIINVVSMLVFVMSIKAQNPDTIVMTEKNIQSSVLREGTNQYLVYFKRGKDAPHSDVELWTIDVKRAIDQNKPVIIVSQTWEYKDTIMHKAYSVSDAKTMQPLTHKTWWSIPKERQTTVDFVHHTLYLNGKELNESDTTKLGKRIWGANKTATDKFLFNWHLDLEVFSMLPYKAGAVFIIPFYDPGTAAPFENVVYSVQGTALLTGYNDQQIACWLLVHNSDGNREVFWVSKKTKEVLKLEQEFGNLYRYKIKLGFSN